MPLSSDMDQKNTLKDWSSHNPRPAAASEDIHSEISINVFHSPTSIGESLFNSQRLDAKSTNEEMVNRLMSSYPSTTRKPS